jgi:hypothetical protein
VPKKRRREKKKEKKLISAFSGSIIPEMYGSIRNVGFW